jgi:parallel beta-helix repeat protein
MPILFANNASSTLASGIGAEDETLSLAAGDGALFPSPGTGEYFLLALVDEANQVEIVKATARSGDDLTVVRGQEGTTPAAYGAGDRVELRLTKETMQSFLQNGELEAGYFSSIKNVVYVSASAEINDHGDPMQAGSLAAAIEGLGAAEAVIELPGDHVYVLGTSLTAPENVSLSFQPGAVIEVAPAATLTVNGEIHAGQRRLFTGDGTVDGSLARRPALPQWWGAKGDGTSDDTAALQAALAFSRVFLPLGAYLLSAPLTLSGAVSLAGEAGYGGYIDWSEDFEQFSPTYAGAASVLQYDQGVHGALFTAKDGVCFEKLVFRCGQARNAQDAFFSGPADALSLRSCRFENLAEVVADQSYTQEFGNISARGCGFFACGDVFKGVLVDCRVVDNLFTSNGCCLDLGSGSGFNSVVSNRFEWCDKAVVLFESRSNTIAANLFDSTEECGLRIHDSTNVNVTGNTFWRNGRDGSSAGKRSHLHIKGSLSASNRITANTFLAGADDGVSPPDRPEAVLEVESAPDTFNLFQSNDTAEGAVTRPAMDTYVSSGRALFMDDMHVKGLGSPGTAADTLSNMLKHLANLAAGPVRVHLYEDRRFTAYENFQTGRVILVGHGSITLSDDSGQANKLLGVQDLVYGPTFGHPPGASAADSAPTAGWWERGAVVWNTAPSASGYAGWICVAEGAPGTWKGFGSIEA